MRKSHVLVTAPTLEPVTLSEAKKHLRVTIDDDDTYISTLITVARQYAEERDSRALITQTWRLYMDEFPAHDESIKLEPTPIQSVTSIKYTPDGGSETTFAASNYIVDTHSKPGRIVLELTKTWPADVLVSANAIEIEFVAGHGDAASDVPTRTKQGMLLLISHLYEMREPIIVGETLASVPMSVDALLDLDRVIQFA